MKKNICYTSIFFTCKGYQTELVAKPAQNCFSNICCVFPSWVLRIASVLSFIPFLPVLCASQAHFFLFLSLLPT